MILSVLIGVLVLLFFKSLILKNTKAHPNEPVQVGFALPLLGHFFKIGLQPHHALLAMTRQYGRVYKFWMGVYPSLIISDPQTYREITLTHFESFVNRPDSPLTDLYSRKYKSLTLGKDSDWRLIRSVVASSFSNSKIRKYSDMIEAEVSQLLIEFNNLFKLNQSFKPRRYLRTFTLNIILRYVFSHKVRYGETLVDERTVNILKHLDLFFESLSWPLRITTQTDWVLSKVLEWRGDPITRCMKYVQEFYDEHLATLNPEEPRDLMDHLIIALDGKKDNCLTTLLVGIDFLNAGTETSASTLEWLLLYMVNYPEIQDKVYSELNELATTDPVTKTKSLRIANRPNTPYFNAVIRECMRIRAVAPLGVPRVASEDVQVGQYFIPKDTHVYLFAHGIMNDPDQWENPTEFNPQRFLNNPHNDTFVPFSLGSRNCVGMTLALDEIYLVASNILLNYHLNSINGQTIDDTDEYKFTLRPKTEYSVKLESREDRVLSNSNQRCC